MTYEERWLLRFYEMKLTVPHPWEEDPRFSVVDYDDKGKPIVVQKGREHMYIPTTTIPVIG